MGIVETAVQSIDKLSELIPVVQDLGAKHYPYGAQAAHLKVCMDNCV